jgi:hypothetical protein
MEKEKKHRKTRERLRRFTTKAHKGGHEVEEGRKGKPEGLGLRLSPFFAVGAFVVKNS